VSSTYHSIARVINTTVAEPKLHICFGSSSGYGSGFKKVSAPDPAPAPTSVLLLPFCTAFKEKVDFSCFFGKNIDLLHLLDPIQY
jgi:hypothetical protein